MWVRCAQVQLQESSCFRIASLVSDGLLVKQQRDNDEAPRDSLHNFLFVLEELNLLVPFPDHALNATTPSPSSSAGRAGGGEGKVEGEGEAQFLGARLHLSGFSAVHDNMQVCTDGCYSTIALTEQSYALKSINKCRISHMQNSMWHAAVTCFTAGRE